MSRAVAGVLVAAAAALSCAQPGTPPGGPVDESPPRVIETRPAALDTLRDLSRPVVIRFDERISERMEGVAELRDAVLVSPAKGVPLVDRGRRSIEVRIAGGWEPDRVYRVVILPVFRDLFGNQREEPVDLVFTTGAPITEGALAGFLNDRITGAPVPEARVNAERRENGDRYVAVTDTAGFFALRFLPAGTYDLVGWLDQDRDREVDFFEAQDTTDSSLAGSDTLVVELALLPMDSTAAQLARAVPIDSTRVRLVFDDYFAVDSVPGRAHLYLLPDTTLVTDGGRLVHGSRLDSILAAEEAARDSLQAVQDSLAALEDAGRDTTGGGTAAAGADTAAGAPVRRAAAASAGRARPGPGGGSQDQGRQSGRQGAAEQPLPSRELILFLPGPLIPDTTYYVEVVGVINIRGVPGGGGGANFRTPALPDTATADTTGIDTTGAGPAMPDSVPPDTAGPAPDTTPADATGGSGG